MNEKIHELALQAGGSHYPAVGGDNLTKFAKLLVTHVVGKIENEIELAHEQGETWTAATLEALCLDILNDFDMELEDENQSVDVNDNWDAEAELQKLVDELDLHRKG